MANLIKRVLVDASGFDTTKRIVRPDGEVRYIRCVGAAVVENQKLKKYIGTALDVTEQELPTQEFRRRGHFSNKRKRSVTPVALAGMYRAGSWFGRTKNFESWVTSATVKPTLDLALKRIHPEDLLFVQRMMEKAKSGENLELEHRLLMPDGSVKHVHVIARPLTNEAGEIEVSRNRNGHHCQEEGIRRN